MSIGAVIVMATKFFALTNPTHAVYEYEQCVSYRDTYRVTFLDSRVVVCWGKHENIATTLCNKQEGGFVSWGK